MTQAELAAAADVHQPTIAAYESGRRTPSDETLRRLLDVARTRPSIALAVLADEIISSALAHGITDVRVFGSVLDGSDTEHSDIDLLVSAGADRSLFDLGAFAADVQQLTGFPVDVMTDSQAEAPAFTRVREGAVALMESEENDARFAPRPRKPVEASTQSKIDRLPQVKAELERILADAERIVSRGEDAFLSEDDRTNYLAGSALIIHFDDIARHRLGDETRRAFPAALWSQISATRNILAHNYAAADRRTVWLSLSIELPQLVRRILAA
jgi:predicted nucleotidyltransferase/uncharacterized protein with HEPN domain